MVMWQMKKRGIKDEVLVASVIVMDGSVIS